MVMTNKNYRAPLIKRKEVYKGLAIYTRYNPRDKLAAMETQHKPDADSPRMNSTTRVGIRTMSLE